MSSRVSSTSTTPDFTSSFTISPIPLSSTSLSSSFSVMSISTSAVVSTSAPTNSSLSADPSSSSDTASTFSSSAVPISGSTTTPFPTTLIVSTTQVDKYSTTPATTPWTSTLILTSILPGHSTTTWTTTTTSEVLSTAVIHTTGNRWALCPRGVAMKSPAITMLMEINAGSPVPLVLLPVLSSASSELLPSPFFGFSVLVADSARYLVMRALFLHGRLAARLKLK
ncbi:hypothetical protein EDB19DRAFT_1236142 [Suillus lakei]|nr:hypothetical protein EDB19DRAFT_1236142 [Suillus lakei]